jgi:PAS domain S-box-containing protein
VGTYLGGANLLKKPRRAFGYFTHSATDPSGLANPAVSAFLEDAKGRIWVGTERGWLHLFERDAGGFVRYRFPSDVAGGSAILALQEDRRGRIWVGTYRGGLGRFDPRTGRFAVFKHRTGDETSISDDDVWAIVAEEGALWLGTARGIDRFDPDRGVVIEHHDTPGREGLGNTGVRALLRDRQGNLWVGTVGGLNLRLRGGGGFVHYRHDPSDPKSLSNDVVMALHQDRQGRLWVGTLGGGVGVLDLAHGTFTSYKNFPSNVVHGIQEDALGRLWISTNHGLSRLDPANGHVDNYDLTNGLQSLQFHLSASLETRAGRLLFGSVDGFYDFDPQAITPDTYAPPVVVTSLRVFNEPVKLPAALSSLQEITLSPQDKVVSLEFAALDYALPRRNQYAYKLEGFSDQWIQLQGKRDVTFTNLDPGSYVFRVKASNSDGVWSEASAAALRIAVRPPFWKTWWFRSLAAGLAVFALVAAHRVRVRNLKADLVERRRVEHALRQAEEKYRSIFEHAMEGIYQANHEGRFLTVNPAMARMLGYASPSEMLIEVTDIPKQIFVDPKRCEEMLRLVDEHGVVHGFESQLRRRDGSVFWVSHNVRIVRDDAGRALYYEGSSVEIANRRRAS